MEVPKTFLTNRMCFLKELKLLWTPIALTLTLITRPRPKWVRIEWWVLMDLEGNPQRIQGSTIMLCLSATLYLRVSWGRTMGKRKGFLVLKIDRRHQIWGWNLGYSQPRTFLNEEIRITLLLSEIKDFRIWHLQQTIQVSMTNSLNSLTVRHSSFKVETPALEARATKISIDWWKPHPTHRSLAVSKLFKTRDMEFHKTLTLESQVKRWSWLKLGWTETKI